MRVTEEQPIEQKGACIFSMPDSYSLNFHKFSMDVGQALKSMKAPCPTWACAGRGSWCRGPFLGRDSGMVIVDVYPFC